MKAILVIDEMPKRCGDCICYQCGFCITNFGVVNMDDKPADGCPLKPLPKERELKSTEYLEHYRLGYTGTYEREAYSIGWNDCLKEIEQ